MSELRPKEKLIIIVVTVLFLLLFFTFEIWLPSKTIGYRKCTRWNPALSVGRFQYRCLEWEDLGY